MSWKDALWNHFPALFLGCALCLGIGCALGSSWTLILIALLAASQYDHSRRVLLVLAVAGLGYLQIPLRYQLPEQATASGKISFVVEDVERRVSHIGASWHCRGTVEKVVSPQGQIHAAGIPASCYRSCRTERPTPGTRYRLLGTLRNSGHGHFYTLKVRKGSWHAEEQLGSLAEKRLHAKQWLADHISHRIQSPEAAALLTGLLTGQFADRSTRLEFGRLGLQHVMAISGFHFAIMASVLGLGLRSVLGARLQAAGMLLLLSLYFLFVGPRASVCRAWIAVMLTWSGLLFNRQCSGLNSLGVAALYLGISDPFAIESIGFLFSFLATAGILILYAPCHQVLTQLLPERSYKEVLQQGKRQQLALLFAASLRSGLALLLAVHATVLPLLLALFHKVSVLGFVYNLFYPALVSVALTLLIVGTLCPPLVDPITNSYCNLLLDLVHHAPTNLDLSLRVRSFPTELSILIITALLTWGLRNIGNKLYI